MPRFDVAEISSYETAKDLLFVDVVGTKVNAKMLAKVPHTDMEDSHILDDDRRNNAKLFE